MANFFFHDDIFFKKNGSLQKVAEKHLFIMPFSRFRLICGSLCI